MIRLVAVAVVAAAGAPTARAEPCRAGAVSTAPEPGVSATSVRLDRAAIERRPHARPTDLTRHLPGLVTFATAGGALADQWLVRGVDAGHGGDLAVTVDGVPVNLPSHAVSQGYADTHFVIPDAIAAVALDKGPYAADRGDFATAGALAIETIDEVPGGYAVRASTERPLSGPAGTLEREPRRIPYVLTGMASPSLDCGRAIVAAEVGFHDGPYVNPQRFEHGAVLAKYRRSVGAGELAIAATFHAARWADSGVIPAAEVDAGRVSHFGAADPTQGGGSSRISASIGFAVGAPAGDGWRVGAYVVSSDLRRFANPTIFLRDVDRGDQIEQVDRRTTFGLDGAFRRRHRLGPIRGRLRLGVAARTDAVTADLWHTERRRRLDGCFGPANPCTRTTARIHDVAIYADDELALGPARIVPGLRLDQLSWDLEDLDPETATASTQLSGLAGNGRLSPKLAAVWTATANLDVRVAVAGGFHSSDARVAAPAGGFRSVARIWAAEVGVHAHPGDRVRAAAAVWWSRLEANQVWVADRGEPASVPAADRYGIETMVVAEPTDWLALDAGVSVARGRALPDVGSATRLPGAPRLSGGGGVAVHRRASYAALRAVGLGPRPLAIQPAIVADGYVVWSLVAGTRWRRYELTLTVDNLADVRWRETQVATAVRPSREVEPTLGISFAPGSPRTVTLTVGVVGF